MSKGPSQERMRYDLESDVWSWELLDGAIVSAHEIGGVIVHFSESRIPVLIEILDAGRFLAKTKKISEAGDVPLEGVAPALQ